MLIPAMGQNSPYLSVAQIADQFSIKDKDALRKKLERFREKNAMNKDAFIESQNRGKNNPKYFYNVSMVEQIVQDLSVKRPSKKKL